MCERRGKKINKAPSILRPSRDLPMPSFAPDSSRLRSLLPETKVEKAATILRSRVGAAAVSGAMPRGNSFGASELVAAVALGAELGAEKLEPGAGLGALGVGHCIAIGATVVEGTIGGVFEAAEIFVPIHSDVGLSGREIGSGLSGIVAGRTVVGAGS